MSLKRLISLLALASVSAAAPVTNTGFSAASIAVNVIALSGAAEYGMWVSTDGTWYSTSAIACLNIGASSWTACSEPIFNQIAVVAGYTCAFGGPSWTASQVGTSNSGFLQIGPPQKINAIACVPNF